MLANSSKLLLVDDDSQLAVMLHEYLELQGFQVELCEDGESALQTIAQALPDLVILDVMLPGINGFDVLEKLREQHSDLPVIMLTARGEESDRILGLMRGADDYLPKPFNPLELSARIQAVLKRSGSSKPEVVEFLTSGPLHLNLSRRELTASGAAVAVTAAEMHVLEQLLRHPDEVLSRARLTELALERPIEAYDRSIDTLISKLRRKLAAAGVNKDCIRGLRGHGYVLDTSVFGEET
jgi:DNA-binding response OmpR family regulator